MLSMMSCEMLFSGPIDPTQNGLQLQSLDMSQRMRLLQWKLIGSKAKAKVKKKSHGKGKQDGKGKGYGAYGFGKVRDLKGHNGKTDSKGYRDGKGGGDKGKGKDKGKYTKGSNN